jgi:hypothetical protein
LRAWSSATLKKRFGIGIDLRDVADPDTLCRAAEGLKKKLGWHCVLFGGGWAIPIEQIHDLIVKQLPKK